MVKLGCIPKERGATENNLVLKLVLIVADHSLDMQIRPLHQYKALLLCKCSCYLKEFGSGPRAAFVAPAGKPSFEVRGRDEQRRHWIPWSLVILLAQPPDCMVLGFSAAGHNFNAHLWRPCHNNKTNQRSCKLH